MATLLLGLAFTSCEKENTSGGNNGGGNNGDPVITDDDTGIELNLSNNNNDDRIYFTTEYVSNEGYVYEGRCYLRMTSSNNFVLSDNYGNLSYDIASVGQVTSLASVNNIPTSGWVNQIAVNPGTGYIVRYKGQGFGYTYARLYVKDWIISTSGGIIGSTVLYQDKWGQEFTGNEFIGSKWKYESTSQDENGVTVTASWTLEFNSGNQGDINYFITDGVDSESERWTFSYNYNYNTKQGYLIFSDNGGQWFFSVSGNQMILVDQYNNETVFNRI